MLGIYIHVPFCVSKCPYCDFYSLTGSTEETKDAYVQALIREMDRWATHGDTVDTVYFGGGTPSLLGGARLARLLEAARRRFAFAADTEITLEANPADDLAETFAAFAAAGGNRISLGMQDADDTQLRRLGRRHTAAQVETAVAAAKAAGITNVSLDMMLGTEGQTAEQVKAAAARCAALGASHVSAYLLKLEPHTPFGNCPPPLPDEEETVALYHTAADELAKYGYEQYEISNFAKGGKVSRHNLKYWNLEPYIGLGPSAHSFYNGRRVYYPRSLEAFLAGCDPVLEGDNECIDENSPEEYAMLRLRLTEGLTEQGFAARYGTPIPARWRQKAEALPSSLVVTDTAGIRLTRDGFLVSDAVIAEILL